MANTQYFVRAYAINSHGTAYGNILEFTTTVVGLPQIPENVIATAGDKVVTISWNVASEASEYNIYWSTESDVSRTKYSGVFSNISETSFLHTQLGVGIRYYYVVTSENGIGESSESQVAMSATPLLYESNSISSQGAKQYYQITISDGEDLFIRTNISSEHQDYYLYVKFGTVPTTIDYDTCSKTGADEAIHISNTQAGTYYIMVYAQDYENLVTGAYTITGSTNVNSLNIGTNFNSTITHTQEKHFYEVDVQEGENLFVNVYRATTWQKYHLYAKYGTLPTLADFDANSVTGEDEFVGIFGTQAGTYYIMVFAHDYEHLADGSYSIEIKNEF
jgi:hypothetical protein